ncbi:fasciclin domain-containing protein [Spirosoma validum]|uniref:Fasciclin domain-containing protein n=1 Tax=Spirosoma validum TaxID=2771355 RepID=A0A927AXQ1_9BACT|nr:fasciclin domain-containing protein [Spirosoma validum]MBD2751698.1 fasciclin domain-containing protein [Spirosoma validum]
MMTSFSGLPGRISILALLLLVAVSCKKGDDTVAAPQTIPDRVLEDSQFSLLRVALAYAGVSDALKSGNLTLFAPTDSAFQASGFGSISSIQSLSRDQVRSMMLYHVLYGSVTSAQIPSGFNAVETVGKGIAFFTKSNDGTIYINNAKLTQPDLVTANGYIHKVNRLLTPSAGNLLTTIQSNPNLTFLAAAVKRIGTSNPTLLATLNNSSSTNTVTVFAPNDEAFKADSRYNTITAIESADQQTLANTLLYHVTSGVLFSNQLKTGTLTSLFNTNKFTVTVAPNQITLKGNRNATFATIRQADIPTTSGLIHVIDKVLQP